MTETPDPAPETLSDATLRRILTRCRCIAVVGVSPNPIRPSFFVARYLSLKGFRVIPVNPGHAGETLFGETVRAGLEDCPPEVDLLDIFRRSDHVPPIVAEGIERLPNLRTIWLQIGVESAAARDMAQAKGLDFVQNRCPKIEYQRLFGELRMGGFATGVISSKL
jgi:predicted CoA-binding protein